MAYEDDLAFLRTVNHQSRAGTLENLNPAFVSGLAAAIRQAQSQGMQVGIASGYRAPGVVQSQRPGSNAANYDLHGNSLHTYGMAVDVDGIGKPGSDTAQQWQQIAEANGIYNPYGYQNGSEWNHYQAIPYKNLSIPDRNALFQAYQNGDWNSVWNIGQGLIGNRAVAAAAPAANRVTIMPNGSPDYSSMIQNYANQIGLNPNQALAIARAEGLNDWNAKNPNAQSNVIGPGGQRETSYGDFQLHTGGGLGDLALRAGIDPTDPSQRWAADKFALDYMKAHGVSAWQSDPAAKAILAQGGLTIGQPTQGAAPAATTSPGPIDPSIVARGGTSPAIPAAGYGTSVASNAPAAASPTGPPTSVADLVGRLTTPAKDAQGNVQPGTSFLDKVAKPFEQNKDLMAEAVRNAPNMMQPPPDTSAQLAPAAQQMLASTMASAARPLTWSAAPYGAGMAGQQMGSPQGYPMPQGGIQQPQIPGLTLNSLGMGMGYYG